MKFVDQASAECLIFIFLASTLIYAAASDLFRYIIPNYISIFVVVLFGLAWLLTPAVVSIWAYLGAGFVVLLVGMVLFSLGLFGGGDVKLWAASATWYGFDPLHTQLAYVSLIGAGIGVFLYVARLIAGRSHKLSTGPAHMTLPRILQSGAPIPYGLAIAAGTLLTLNRTPFFPNIFG